MYKYSVMICDDSIAVHRSLGSYLRNEKIDVVSAFTGEDALKLLEGSHFDVIILDIMLPGINGHDVCRRIRKDDQDTYIMMLSAKGEVMDRVVGLEIGADEYIAKPFSPKEVSIRVRKIISRLSPEENVKKLSFEGLEINMESYQASFEGKQCELTSRETGVLEMLIRNVGKVVSREKLIETVWGFDYDGDVRAVDSLIKRMKKKLADIDADINLKSIYGVGFRLDRK